MIQGRKGKEQNRRIQSEILGIYVEQLRILQSHKLLRTRHITVLAFNVLATLNWFLRWYDPEGPVSEEDVYEEIIDFVLHGMCGDRADEVLNKEAALAAGNNT